MVSCYGEHVYCTYTDPRQQQGAMNSVSPSLVFKQMVHRFVSSVGDDDWVWNAWISPHTWIGKHNKKEKRFSSFPPRSHILTGPLPTSQNTPASHFPRHSCLTPPARLLFLFPSLPLSHRIHLTCWNSAGLSRWWKAPCRTKRGWWWSSSKEYKSCWSISNDMICVWRQQVCRFKITKEDGVSKRRLKKIQKKDLLFANVNKNTKSGKVKEEEERKKKEPKGIYTTKSGV